MLEIQHVQNVIAVVLEWSRRRPLHAIALVGSHARGEARPESDIDLMILVSDPKEFRSPEWLAELDWVRVGGHPIAYRDVQYGSVWSRHLRLEGGLEVEFSFGEPSWADVSPVDGGTHQVITDGFRILYDPEGLLEALVSALAKDEPIALL